jgi:hypothetical protein
VDVEDVVPPYILAHLADGFQERLPLDVAYRAADFNQGNIGFESLCSQDNAALDLIGDVGDGLNSTPR